MSLYKCTECFEIKDFFRKYQIKYTKQRHMIYNVLIEAEQPLTAEEIFFKGKNLKDSISLSTVYRITETFVSKGLARKSGMTEGNRVMFELNRKDHNHHLICIGCKKMQVVSHCPLESYEESLSQSTDFMITGHQLSIYGYCGNCKNNLEE